MSEKGENNGISCCSKFPMLLFVWQSTTYQTMVITKSSLLCANEWKSHFKGDQYL